MAYNNVKVKSRQTITQSTTKTEPLGIVAEVPMGDWARTVAYEKLNKVRYIQKGGVGVTLLAKKANRGIEPFISSNWQDIWMIENYDGGSVIPNGTYPNMTVGKAINDGAGNNIANQFSNVKSDIIGLRADITNEAHFRGYLATNAEIQALIGTPNDYAYSAESGTVWIYQTATGWTNSGKPVPDQTTPASNSTPLMDGTASVGVANEYSRGDHVHPSDTSKADKVGDFPEMIVGSANNLSGAWWETKTIKHITDSNYNGAIKLTLEISSFPQTQYAIPFFLLTVNAGYFNTNHSSGVTKIYNFSSNKETSTGRYLSVGNSNVDNTVPIRLGDPYKNETNWYIDVIILGDNQGLDVTFNMLYTKYNTYTLFDFDISETHIDNASISDFPYPANAENHYSVDASQLNSNTWYPVIIPVSPRKVSHIRCQASLYGDNTNGSGNVEWSTHSSKTISYLADWEVTGNDWGGGFEARTIRYYDWSFGENVFGSIGQLTNSSNDYVYVRGGAIYQFYCTEGVLQPPKLYTTKFEVSGQSVEPITIYYSNLRKGFTGAPNLKFEALQILDNGERVYSPNNPPPTISGQDKMQGATGSITLPESGLYSIRILDTTNMITANWVAYWENTDIQSPIYKNVTQNASNMFSVIIQNGKILWVNVISGNIVSAQAIVYRMK